MQLFLFSILRNLVVAAAMAFLSAVIYRPKAAGTDPPKPQRIDFAPTADEGTEIKHLFGTGPVELLVVWVGDKSVEPIVK